MRYVVLIFSALLFVHPSAGGSECGCKKDKIGGQIELIAGDDDQRGLIGAVDPNTGNYIFVWKAVKRTPGTPSEGLLKIQVFDFELNPVTTPQVIDRIPNPRNGSIDQYMFIIPGSNHRYLVLWSSAIYSSSNSSDWVDEFTGQYFSASAQPVSSQIRLFRNNWVDRKTPHVYSVAYNSDRNEYALLIDQSDKGRIEKRNGTLAKISSVNLNSPVVAGSIRYLKNDRRYFAAWNDYEMNYHAFLTENLQLSSNLFHYSCGGFSALLQDPKTSLPVVMSCGANFIGKDGRILATKPITFRFGAIRNNPKTGGFLSFGQVNHREPQISRIDSSFQTTEREVPIACTNGHHSHSYFLIYNPVKEEFVAIWSNRGYLPILAQRIRAIPANGSCKE